jgi:DNA-binding transcriptional ArsR family regulator
MRNRIGLHYSNNRASILRDACDGRRIVPENIPAGAEALPESVLQDTAALFGLMSASVRLHLLWLLSIGEHDVGSLAETTGQSLATVSHHLGKLKLAGLVQAQRFGRRRVYVLADADAAAMVRLAITRGLERIVSSDRRRRA